MERQCADFRFGDDGAVCRPVVLCDFRLPVLPESARRDEVHLWQDEEEGGDIGSALYHRVSVLCWLWSAYGCIAWCVKVYEQFDDASFFKTGGRNSS